MSNYIAIPVLMVAAIVNSAVMPEFRLGGGAPDVVFLLVISWGLLVDVRAALTWAVIGGVMQDWLSIAPLGTSALGLAMVVFAADTAFRQVPRGSLLIPPLVAGAGTVAYHLIVLGVLGLTGTTVPIGQGLYYVTLPTVIYNTVLIVPVFRVMGTIHRWLSPRRPPIGG
ncbi:MAG: rod shape-determining protein MreD [Anaerolineae bacterium]|nr:rod shape-determining protein MreD [Anaerolineae bacterium]